MVTGNFSFKHKIQININRNFLNSKGGISSSVNTTYLVLAESNRGLKAS